MEKLAGSQMHGPWVGSYIVVWWTNGKHDESSFLDVVAHVTAGICVAEWQVNGLLTLLMKKMSV